MATKKIKKSLSPELKINIEKTREMVLRSMKADIPLMLRGSMGIGKSEGIRQVCKMAAGIDPRKWKSLDDRKNSEKYYPVGSNIEEFKFEDDKGNITRYGLVDIRLTLCSDPSDLKGIPFFYEDPETKEKMMKWAKSEEFPSPEQTKDYDKVIVLLDELPSAPPYIQVAAFQLILDRKVGSFCLPDNTYILGAGNTADDRSVTYDMPSPLANRMCHLSIESDYTSWENWAMLNDVHPMVISYLASSTEFLFEFDKGGKSNSSDMSKGFPTPRSWNNVSKFMKGNTDISMDDLHIFVQGLIGPSMATLFIGHVEQSMQLPRTSDILSGKITEMKIDDELKTAATYFIFLSCNSELEKLCQGKTKIDPELRSKFVNVMKYYKENFNEDFIMVSFRDLIQNRDFNRNVNDELYEIPEYDDIVTKYGDIFVTNIEL